MLGVFPKNAEASRFHGTFLKSAQEFENKELFFPFLRE
jgi:hypothetical protein